MDTTNKWRYRFYNKSLVIGRVVWCCALQVLADTFAGFGFVLRHNRKRLRLFP